MATLNTPYAILAFPALFQARPKFGDAADLVYEATLIFPPTSQTSPAYKAMQDAVIAQCKEGFGEQVKMNTLMLPFHDAGEKAGVWNGFEPGHTYVKTWSKGKPGVVDARREDILLPEEVWAGQMVRANITPKWWNNNNKRGVSFYLNHIQVIKTDMPRIDGKASAAKAFDDSLVEASEESIF